MTEQTLKYETPSQRRTFRVTAPMRMTINGEIFTVSNWSVLDFRIENYTGNLNEGEEFLVHVQVPYQGFDLAFQTKMRVSLVDKDKQRLAGEFINMADREKEILTTFVAGLVRGEMDTVNGVIRRMDVPVTPASLQPDAVLTDDEMVQQERRRKLGSILYGLAGVIFTIIVAVVIYTNFFQIKVETAVMASPTDIIIAPATGNIKSYDVETRSVVEAGASIMSFVDPELEQNIGRAALRLEEAIVTHSGEKQQSVSALEDRQIVSARAEVTAQQNNLNVQAKRMTRLRSAVKQGLARRMDLEQAQGAYYRAQADLNSAMQGLNRASQKGGTQSTLLSLAEGEYHLLKEQRTRLSVTAPAQGRIITQLVREGAAVRYGDPVAIFQHDGPRYIEAYLTREEALSIAIGDDVAVYFPSHDHESDYKVMDIDYASQLVGKRDGRFYMEQAGKTRDVLVRLETPEGFVDEVIDTIIPGTSAVVVFDKPFYR